MDSGGQTPIQAARIELACGPVDQLDAQPRFQLLHQLRHAGLAHVQRLGSLGEAAGFHHARECLRRFSRRPCPIKRRLIEPDGSPRWAEIGSLAGAIYLISALLALAALAVALGMRTASRERSDTHADKG
ncbi:hypothetical protein D3C76_1095970 [compost metagenome]